MPADDRLDALAESVSDGRRIDWNGAETGAGEGDGASIRALRDVERIAEFNRALQRSGGPGGGPRGAAPSNDTPGPERWGPLTLLARVGSGATGEVWRAWDATLQREVALKFLTSRGDDAGESGLAALLEEARSLARVRHPGIVAVHGIAEHDGRAGMWMEYLHGTTLADEIERRGALPPLEVARIGVQLCSALEAVERAGLVHRDLKPSNVVLEPDGRAVLTDFGLGWRRSAAGAKEEPRGSGTPIFMSPGLLTGDAATARSDVYALGVTLRWALTGHSPFAARTLDELEVEARRGPSVPLERERADAPETLIAAIEGAMTPDAGARIHSGAMGALLSSALDDLDRTRPARKRPWALAIAAITLGLAAITLSIVPRFIVSRPDWTAPDGRGAERGGAGAPSAGAPAGAAAVTPGATTTASAYTVDASLVVRNGGGYRRLAPGDRVAPGDRLSLEFRASRPVWVYVLNEDERGETYLLYPQPLFDVVNPIAPESTTLLPGPVGGRENSWQVTSRGGREHFLVVASPEPVPEIEAELKRLPAARPGRPIQYAAVAPAAVDRLRGVGGVAPLPTDVKPRVSGAFDRFQALAGRETVARGTWARTITLENPLR